MSGHQDISGEVVQKTPTHGDHQQSSPLPRLALSKKNPKVKQHQRNPLSSPYFSSLPDRSPKRRVKAAKKGQRKAVAVGQERIETEEPRNRRSMTAAQQPVPNELHSPESPLRLRKYTAPAREQDSRSLHVRRRVRHKRGSFGENSTVAERKPLQRSSAPVQHGPQNEQLPRESQQPNAGHGTNFVVGARESIADPGFESRQQQREMRRARRRKRTAMSTREAAPVESIVTHHAHSPFRADGQFSKTPRFSQKTSPLPYQIQVQSASKSPSKAETALHVAEKVYSVQSLNDHSTREVAVAIPRLRHSQRGQRRGMVQYMRKLLNLKRSEHRAMLFQYACRIQGMYRCWKARRLMGDLKIHAKALMLQLFFRQRKAYGELIALQEARRHSSATTIQLMYRRRVAIRETHRRRRIRCATSIQSLFRGWIQRHKRWAANGLQKVYRGHLTRSIVRLWHRAATTIEALYRKMLAQKRVERWRTDFDGLVAHALKVYSYCCSTNWTRSRMNELFDLLQSDVARQQENWPELLEYHVVDDALQKSTAAVTFNRRLTAQAEDQLRQLCSETPQVVAPDQTTRVAQEQIAKLLARASCFGITAKDEVFVSSRAALRRIQAGEIAEVATCLETRIESGAVLDIHYVDAVQACASQLDSTVPSFTEVIARLSTLRQQTLNAVEDMNLGLLAKLRGLAQIIVTKHKTWHEQQLYKCLPDFHTCVSMWFASVSNLSATASNRGDTYLAGQLEDEVTEMSAFLQAQVPSVDQISIFCDAFLAAIGTELPQEKCVGDQCKADSVALATQFWVTHDHVIGRPCQRTPLAQALETHFLHIRRLESRSRVQHAAMFFTNAMVNVVNQRPKLGEIYNGGGPVDIDEGTCAPQSNAEQKSAILGRVHRVDIRRFVNALQQAARGIQWYDSVDAFEAAQVRLHFLLDHCCHVNLSSDVPESKIDKVVDSQATADETVDVASERDSVRDRDEQVLHSKFENLIAIDKLRRAMQEVLLFASTRDNAIQSSIRRCREVLASKAHTHEDDKLPQSPFPQLPIEKDATMLHARIIWRLASVVSGNLCVDTRSAVVSARNTLPIAIELMDEVVSRISLDASRSVHIDCQCAHDVFDNVWRRELLFSITLGILRSQYETAGIDIDSAMVRSVLEEASPFDVLSFTSLPKRLFKPGARVFGPTAPRGSLAEGVVRTVATDSATVIIEFDKCGLTLELPSFLVAATKGAIPKAESHPRRVPDFPFAAAVGQRVECMPLFVEDEWLEGVITEKLSCNSFSVMIPSMSMCAQFVRAARLRPPGDVVIAMHEGMWVEFSQLPGKFEEAVVDSFDPKTRSCCVLCEQPGLAVLRQLQVATVMVRPYFKHETLESRVEVLVDHQQPGDMKWRAATVLQNRVTGFVDVKLEDTTDATVVEEVPLLQIRPLHRQQGIKLCDVPVGAFVEVAIGESELAWCVGRIDNVSLESGTCSVRYIREPGGQMLSANLDAFSKLRAFSRAFGAGDQVEVFIESTWKPASIVDVLESGAFVLKSAIDGHVIKNRAGVIYSNQSLSVRPALNEDPFSLVWQEIELGMVLEAFVPDVNEGAPPAWQKIVIHTLDKDAHCVSGMRFANPLAPSVSVSVRELRANTSICVVGTEVEALFGSGGSDWLDARVVDSTPNSVCKLQFSDVDLEEENVRPIFMRPRLNMSLKERLTTIAKIPELDPSELVPGMDLCFASPNSKTAENETLLLCRFVSASPDGKCVVRILEPSGAFEANESTSVPLPEIRVGPRNFEPGHAVEALLPGDDDYVWHHCIVELHSPDGSFDLLYTDIGDSGEKHEMVPELCVRHILPYKTGEKVECQRVAGEEWADATIRQSNDDGSFDVEFTNDQLEEIRVPAHCVRRPQSSSEPSRVGDEKISQRRMQTMAMSAVAASVNGVKVGVFAADDVTCSNFHRVREAIILQVATDGEESAKVEYIDSGVVETVPMTRVVFDEYAVLDTKLDVHDIVVGMELEVTSGKDGSVWSACEVVSVSIDDETCLVRAYDPTSGKDVMRNAGMHELRSSHKHFIAGSVVEAVVADDDADPWGVAQVEHTSADGSYDLLFAATGERTIMAPLYVRCFTEYHLGDDVEIRDAGDSEWSHGVISFVNPDRTFDIQQGTSALSILQVPPHLIRPIGGVASEGSLSEDELSEGHVQSMATSAVLATVTGMRVGVFAADDDSLSDFDRAREAIVLKISPEGEGTANVQYDDNGSIEVVAMDRLLFDENAVNSQQLDAADLVPGMELEVMSRADSNEWILGEVVSVAVEARTCVLRVFDDDKGKTVLRTAAMPEIRVGSKQFVVDSVIEAFESDSSNTWQTARVDAVVEDGSFAIQFVDSGNRVVRDALLVRHFRAYGLQDQVECRLDGSDRWQAGIISSVNTDMTFGVTFVGNGEFQTYVLPHMIRPSTATTLDKRTDISSDNILGDQVDDDFSFDLADFVPGSEWEVASNLGSTDSKWSFSVVEAVDLSLGTCTVRVFDTTSGVVDVREVSPSMIRLAPKEFSPGSIVEALVMARGGNEETWVRCLVGHAEPDGLMNLISVETGEEFEEVIPLLIRHVRFYDVGAEVECRRAGEIRWVSATINIVNSNGTFGVVFEDGTADPAVAPHLLRPRDADGSVGSLDSNGGLNNQISSSLGAQKYGDASNSQKSLVSSLEIGMHVAVFADDDAACEDLGRLKHAVVQQINMSEDTVEVLYDGTQTRSVVPTKQILTDDADKLNDLLDITTVLPGMELELIQDAAPGSVPVIGDVVSVSVEKGTCLLMVFDGSVHRTVMRQMHIADLRVAEKRFISGSVVEAIFLADDDNQWEAAVVQALEPNGFFSVRFLETGVSAVLDSLCVRHLKSYELGEEVDYRQELSRQWNSGVIAAVNIDGTFNIERDADGGLEVALAAHLVRPSNVDGTTMASDNESQATEFGEVFVNNSTIAPPTKCDAPDAQRGRPIKDIGMGFDVESGKKDSFTDVSNASIAESEQQIQLSDLVPGVELEVAPRSKEESAAWLVGTIVSLDHDEGQCSLQVFDPAESKMFNQTVPVSELRVGLKSFTTGSIVEAFVASSGAAGAKQWTECVVEAVEGTSGLRLASTASGEKYDRVIPLRVRSARSYHLGAPIECYRDTEERWATGTVLAAGESNTYSVRLDGDSSLETIVPPHWLRHRDTDSTAHTSHLEAPAQFEVGQRVECRFDGGSEYFDARVTLVEQNGTYSVEYDDGDVEQGVDSSMLRFAEALSDDGDNIGDSDTEAGMSEVPFEERGHLQQAGRNTPAFGEEIAEAMAITSNDCDVQDSVQHDAGEAYAEHDENSQRSAGKRQPLQDGVQTNVASAKVTMQSMPEGLREQPMGNASSANCVDETVSHTELSNTAGLAAVQPKPIQGARDGMAVLNTAKEELRSSVNETSVSSAGPDKDDDQESDRESEKKPSDVDDELEAAIFANVLQPREAGPEQLFAFAIGQDVECRFDSGADFFEATIAAQNADGTYDVEYEDGDKEKGVEEAMIRAAEWTDGEESRVDSEEAGSQEPDESPGAVQGSAQKVSNAEDRGHVFAFKIGEEIECRFGGGTDFFEATIVAQNADGTYNVEYEDGDKEVGVNEAMIRGVEWTDGEEDEGQPEEAGEDVDDEEAEFEDSRSQ
eukprot:INCI5906.4.p1 GENE.INCI5906.4~~INCI5906.4.p1  ORF type:complete len:3633 (-),score=669.26 INCI5906.4:838-11736(-)